MSSTYQLLFGIFVADVLYRFFLSSFLLSFTAIQGAQYPFLEINEKLARLQTQNIISQLIM